MWNISRPICNPNELQSLDQSRLEGCIKGVAGHTPPLIPNPNSFHPLTGRRESFGVLILSSSLVLRSSAMGPWRRGMGGEPGLKAMVDHRASLPPPRFARRQRHGPEPRRRQSSEGVGKLPSPDHPVTSSSRSKYVTSSSSSRSRSAGSAAARSQLRLLHLSRRQRGKP